MQVISYQKVPKIFVGDSHQQIYQFRGAVNAMKQVHAAQSLRLSQTFRFGGQPRISIFMTMAVCVCACRVGNAGSGVAAATIAVTFIVALIVWSQ